MCGIFALSSLEPDPNLSKKTLDACVLLRHRGPDHTGIFTSPDFTTALGHTRLSIQDISSLGNQPMFTRDSRFGVVFNGEIYNFKSLRKLLQELGYNFYSNSDTEVLLHLFCEFGLDMFPKLNGIYALAIYDSLTNTIYIARDPSGVKPLYYSCFGSIFACSSELKSLRASFPHCHDIDPKAINQYLTHLWSPGPRTPYKHIRKLEPGVILTVSRGAILSTSEIGSHSPIHLSYTCKRLHATRSSNSLDPISLTADYLRQAVQRQLVSDVPVGAFLSGGLDSSSIVAFARESTPNIRCFTIEMPTSSRDGFADDLPYAVSCAKALNVSLDVVKIDSNDIVSLVDKMIWHLDEPISDPASINVYLISQLAAQSGIKVLLSGSGGDDIFSGYRRHLALSHEKFWSWLPSPLRLLMHTSTDHLPQHIPLFRRLAKTFNGAHLPPDQRIVNYFNWIGNDTLRTLYSQDFERELSSCDRSNYMYEYLLSLPPAYSRLRKMLALEQRFFLSDHNLIYTDKMSMAVGCEVRVPFLDPDLVSFANSLPDHLKVRGSTVKWVLKKAMEPYLPLETIYRPKTGFGMPIRSWLRSELKEWLNDLLSVQSLSNRGIFDPNRVRHLMSLNESGRVDASYTLFSLACLELWFRRLYDTRTPV